MGVGMKGRNEREAEDLKRKIERGMAGVGSRSEAETAWDEIEGAAGELEQEEVPGQRLADGVADESAQELTEAAEIVAKSPAGRAESVDDAVAEAAEETNDPEVRRGRDLLREELVERLGPLEALDTRAFLAINGLPRSPGGDDFFRIFSRAMTGGHAWILVPVVAAFWDQPRARRALLDVLPPLWLATAVVEGVVKPYCRRHRPFVSLVDAVVVGRKPGSYSFPSGHSAAAFAGAMLLGSRYPRGRAAFLLVAGLVGFSRVYLGAHYPGDVVTGGVAGVGLAGFFRGGLRQIFRGRSRD